jgi:magnesium chelatase accessory protein
MFESFYTGMSWADHRSLWPHAQHSQFVQAGGIQWHVQQLGQGPCMLLLHGTGSGSFSWRELLPTLAQHFTVVAPDLPGHAFTSRGPEGALSLPGMSEGLGALLLKLNLNPRVLVGHSAGAAIAAHMVRHHPTMTPNARLIGLNPAWLPLTGGASWLLGPAAKLAELNPLSAWATAKMAKQPGVVSKWLAHTGSTLNAPGLDLYTRVLSNSGHIHGVLSMMATWRLDALASQLRDIRNPVFMAVGTHDRTISPTLAHEACLRMPQAQCVMQQGLGHLAHEQDPEGTAQQILRWCTATSAPL